MFDMLERIDCFHEGLRLEGLLALPQTPGPHPGVLVMANAFGIGEQTRRKAAFLASHGYVALATDMYGGGLRCTSQQQTGAHIGPLLSDAQKLRARVTTWFETLASHAEVDAQKLAAIGYCFGGKCVLELARGGADVKAVVSFHGLLGTTLPAPPGSIKGFVAVYTGALDPYAPPEHVKALQEEMKASGAVLHLTIFGESAHAFTDPDAGAAGLPGLAYDPLAETISWAGTMALLEAAIAVA